MAAAVAWPPLTSHIESFAPWITSAGTRRVRSRSVRSPEARAATAWRVIPTGSWARS